MNGKVILITGGTGSFGQVCTKFLFKRNVKKVIVKIARKLLSRTLAVIKTETPYEIGVIE